MRIQHNIMAMNAYRNYTNNTSALSKNLEKLSSGYKINRAGDDAAGLAISEKMRAQITGLNKAQDNAQDGISLIQTAEGALTEVHDMLNRMTELAEQSANGTYEQVDRDQLQKEFDKLTEEIDRIAEASNFNGIKLLDGSLAGAQETATVTIGGYTIAGLDTSITGVKIDTTPGSGNDNAAFTDASVEDGVLTITGTAKAGTGTELTAATLQQALRNAGYENATVTGNGTFATAAEVKTTKVEPTASTIAGNRGSGFKINFEKGETSLAQVQITGAAATAGGIGTTTKAHAGDNTKTDLTITLDNAKSYTANDINQMLSDAGFSEMTVDFEGSKTGADIVTGLGLGTAQTVTSGVGQKGNGLTLQIGDTGESFNQITVSINSIKSGDLVDMTEGTGLSLADLDISNADSAMTAMSALRGMINYVSDVRGGLGATQNRLEHTINNLSVMEENIQNAESAIRDTDVAEEMMAYTKNNILIQSAQAMLAQANQVPQGVLQLLQ